MRQSWMNTDTYSSYPKMCFHQIYTQPKFSFPDATLTAQLLCGQSCRRAGSSPAGLYQDRSLLPMSAPRDSPLHPPLGSSAIQAHSGLGWAWVVLLLLPDLPHHQRAPWVVLSPECSGSGQEGKRAGKPWAGAGPTTHTQTTPVPTHKRDFPPGRAEIQARQEGGWRAPSQGSSCHDHHRGARAGKNSVLNIVSIKLGLKNFFFLY